MIKCHHKPGTNNGAQGEAHMWRPTRSKCSGRKRTNKSN